MPSAFFELFELICRELQGGKEFVLTERLPVNLLSELQKATKEASAEEALTHSINALQTHFQQKGSTLPFAFDSLTATVTPLDADFISFVSEAFQIRSAGQQSKKFEISITQRLVVRLQTGAFHNIGWPRQTRTHLREINPYLQQLGFENRTLRGKDKDGGLDILWLPPLGTLPVRPLVSFQCKNARFNSATIREANNSVVFSLRAIHRRTHMKSAGVYLSFVVFNDYLGTDMWDMAEGLPYAPLGLSDLAPLTSGVSLDLL